jgi:hypothetical protein
VGDIGVDGIHLQTVPHTHTTLEKFSSGVENSCCDGDNQDDNDGLQAHGLTFSWLRRYDFNPRIQNFLVEKWFLGPKKVENA